MSLSTPDSVQKLQAALHAKAKGSPGYRFYAVYDKLYRADVLAYAYARCKANGGAAGVDGQGFEDIESYGRERWLGELAQKLREKTYRPEAVRRVWIPKPDGKQRPLGIPTVKDRVAQMAAVLVLEPIFEADLPPEQYAYRPGRSALDAVRHVHRLLRTGHVEVVDADLSGYFDSLPHAELLKSVARRVVDGAVLHLVKMWLTAATAMRSLMAALKLTVNESKTRVCRLPEDTFDFLGYTLGRCYSRTDGRAYLGTRPSKKSLRRVFAAIRERSGRRETWRSVPEQIARLNPVLRGWANYFCLGPVSRAYRAVDYHARRWLRQWLRAKYQRQTAGRAYYTDDWLHAELGLVRLSSQTRNFPWAKGVRPSPRAGCGKSARPVR